MTTDQFIEFFSELCSKLLPIIGVIVLIYVILLLRKIIQFFVSMQKTMITVDSTVSVVEEQIRKLTAYNEQIDRAMQQVQSQLSGSTQSYDQKMLQQLQQTKKQIEDTVKMLQTAKEKLVQVRAI